MHGAPKCQHCGSCNTILVDADYMTNLSEKVAVTGIIGIPVAIIWAAFDKSLKTFKCNDCGAAWRNRFI
jgi:hypothetical protein